MKAKIRIDLNERTFRHLVMAVQNPVNRKASAAIPLARLRHR